MFADSCVIRSSWRTSRTYHRCVIRCE